MAYIEKEKYWSRFADNFEEKNNYVIGQKNMDAMLAVLYELNNMKNCLELGCGNGTYSRVIAPQCTQLTATDYSDEMVMECTKRVADIPNIHVEKANCFDTTFNDEQFDTVFMANLFHIVPHQEELLREVSRVLKPRGRLILMSYTMYGMSFIDKLAMGYRYIKTYGKPSPYASTLVPAETHELLSGKGFKVEESRLVGYTSKALFIKAYKNEQI